MSTDRVLVTVAGGVIGRSVVEYLHHRGTQVRGVSRRPPQGEPGRQHLPVDLSDRAQAQEGMAAAADTMRLVFAPYVEREDLQAQIEPKWRS